MTECRDVSARGYLMRCQLMVLSVSRKEGDGYTIVLEDLEGCRRVAPGCQRVDSGNGCVAINLRETSTAYDGDVDGP